MSLIPLPLPDHVKVTTGAGILQGSIAFMNGPILVWGGLISALPNPLPTGYSIIEINKKDYNELFVD